MPSDGNAEQVRQVAAAMTEALLAKLSPSLMTPDMVDERIERMLEHVSTRVPSNADIDERIEHAVAIIENKINRKILAVLFANAAAMMGIAFFLGMLWVQFAEVPQTLAGRGAWMGTIEMRTNGLEQWAEEGADEPYDPPKVTVLPD